METKFTPTKWYNSYRVMPGDTEGDYAQQIHTSDGQTIATIAWYPKPQEEGMHEGKPILVTGTYREANAQANCRRSRIAKGTTRCHFFIITNN
jgi:hypothetical protein